MRARVLNAYTDRIDMTVHHAGSEVDLSGERLAELEGKGFVEALAPGAGPAPGAPDAAEPAAELEGKGFVEALAPGAGPAPGAPDAAEPAAELEAMTAAGLREYISGRGYEPPARARKGELLAIAKGL